MQIHQSPLLHFTGVERRHSIRAIQHKNPLINSDPNLVISSTRFRDPTTNIEYETSGNEHTELIRAKITYFRENIAPDPQIKAFAQKKFKQTLEALIAKIVRTPLQKELEQGRSSENNTYRIFALLTNQKAEITAVDEPHLILAQRLNILENREHIFHTRGKIRGQQLIDALIVLEKAINKA